MKPEIFADGHRFLFLPQGGTGRQLQRRDIPSIALMRNWRQRAIKKGLLKQTFLCKAYLRDCRAAGNRKETPYFKVGCRCGCPSVLSSRHARSGTDLASRRAVIGSSKCTPLSQTSQGSTRNFNYSIVSAKFQEINKSNFRNFPKTD